jgi:hypothetical protein
MKTDVYYPKMPQVKIFPYKGRWRWVISDKCSHEVLEMGDEAKKSHAYDKAYERRKDYIDA